MLDFLSTEWLAALDRAAVSSRGVAGADETTRELVIQQVVTGCETGEAAYFIELRHGDLRVRPGHAAEPTLRFTTDRATASTIARGDESAQTAFIQGRLRVGGDTRALVEHADLLAALDEVFAPVREATAY